MNTHQISEIVKVHLRDMEVVTPMLIRSKINDVATVFKLQVTQEQKQQALNELIRFYSHWIPA